MKKSEKGQILVILGLALVAIMGVTALAVDGSLILNERRQDQSTADSAALAGAGSAAQYLKVNDISSFVCGTAITTSASNVAISAAQNAALADNVSLASGDLSSGNGVTTTCGTSDGKPYMDITVHVASQRELTFGKIVSNQPFYTEVESVARIYVNSSFAGGNGLITTGTTCDSNGGIYALGNGRIYMHSGGIYSSSCLKVTGSSQILSDSQPILYTGRGAIQFYTGSQIQYTGANGLIFDGNAPVYIKLEPDLVVSGLSYQLWSTYVPNPAIPASEWPVPTTAAIPEMDIPAMVTQACSGPARTPTLDWQAETLNPGNYANGIDQGSGALTLNPGVYCIAAGKSVVFDQATVMADNTIFYFQGSGSFTTGGAVGLSMNNSSVYLTNGNFTIPNDSYFHANNITIYIKQGNFTINNGAQNLIMTSPGCSTSACGVGPSIPGVLLYMDEANTGMITVDNGVNAHQINGTMYAPNALAVFSGGTTTNALNVQLIVKRIEVSNGAVLNMDLEGATLFSQGSITIELRK